MVSSICGIDCTQCGFRDSCNGCEETDGRPFGADCIVALCCQKSNDALRELKERLIAQFNALGIDDMEEVKDLNALKGSFVNLAYPFPDGKMVKFWDDNRIYLGNQLHKTDSDRCYGIVADERDLMVSEYGQGGSEAEIVLFKRWNEKR